MASFVDDFAAGIYVENGADAFADDALVVSHEEAAAECADAPFPADEAATATAGDAARLHEFWGGLVLTVALPCAVETTWNGMSLLGVVRMPGLVVANSTLQMDFAHQLRGEGPETAEAIRAAARMRRRSIGTTLLATVLGLAPRAGKLGAGTERDPPLVVYPWGVCWRRDRWLEREAARRLRRGRR